MILLVRSDLWIQLGPVNLVHQIALSDHLVRKNLDFLWDPLIQPDLCHLEGLLVLIDQQGLVDLMDRKDPVHLPSQTVQLHLVSLKGLRHHAVQLVRPDLDFLVSLDHLMVLLAQLAQLLLVLRDCLLVQMFPGFQALHLVLCHRWSLHRPLILEIQRIL